MTKEKLVIASRIAHRISLVQAGLRIAGLMVISYSGCNLSSTPPPNEGEGVVTLSISPVPRLVPPPTGLDYIDAINLSYDAGARGQLISYRWSDLEPSLGVYRFADFSRTLEYLSNSRGFGILLGLQVVNTNVKETPSDLVAVPFDSLRLKQRFHTLIDSALWWQAHP